MVLNKDYDPNRDFVIGNETAARRIVWFVDFTDKPTRRLRDIILRLADRLSPDQVTVAIRFTYPEGDKRADIAARAAIAAGQQGRFFDMFTALFEAPPKYTRPSVIKLANKLGLDLARFEADLDAPDVAQRIQHDRNSLSKEVPPSAPYLFFDGTLYQGVWDEAALLEAIERPLGVRLEVAAYRFIDWAASAGMTLIVATVAALLFVNVGFFDFFDALRNTSIGLFAGSWRLELSLLAWINDALMALFFLLVGIEIKHEFVEGELSNRTAAAMPVIAALGGMLVPAGIYAALNWGTPEVHGWGVPMATDIAFTLGILALLGNRVPTSLKIFVSALAIVDDLGAILVIAAFYGHGFHLAAFITACVIFAAMMAMNVGKIYWRAPYLILGVVLWYFIHESGLHATLAGVLTAIALPSRAKANRAAVAAQTAKLFERDKQIGSENIVAAPTFMQLQTIMDRLGAPGVHVRHALENWINFLVLPLFAFFNTGLLITADSVHFTAPESLGTILGLVVGKPLGIFLFVYVAAKLGLGRLSSEINLMQVLGAGCLAGVGFTMSIFIANSAFTGIQLESVKLSVLLASVIAAVLGSVILVYAHRAVHKRTEDQPAETPAS
ncbi:Na+/H+ antiporter NhaA [Aliiroseovarius sp. Z3]|uniref:Na+/H+ antiporter NhaA n=1 Tax=Aliiroseovarius sp. Z3 TaxID=2811402 RepID=UPI0023B2D283|nr:Na+/H+ antiporter NhaA [Aliiroseovarius sp. Z3]MDE9450493.1 Na+/H+ antiporter NhaA [Aliiroseovarius sp. Z3]